MPTSNKTKIHKPNRKATTYCFHRWQKSVNREHELFWINMFNRFGDLKHEANK
jgi:hypothetical protein